VTSGHAATGRWFAWVAVIALIAGFTALFQALTPGDGGTATTMVRDGRMAVLLQRDRSGHYRAEGQINGHSIDFLVDTGATDVAISVKTARSIGLEFGPEVTVMTAAGPVKAWLARLEEVQIGELRRRNVRTTITPGLGESALLGMSFLRHFSLLQEGETLMIEESGAR
jgi:aspartyl protease family protein